ncbi:hypothetical protein FH972_022873 [Carpinus fangiana]|uniref:N-acetyltransferase domain-containing protein n=1 Tax=Carpinus fangiana TaxID=176857 RepID=A0A5N6KU66_9ROSI|nr:hypothetical protein FH972_022873 [Carpinus fangiana]
MVDSRIISGSSQDASRGKGLCSAMVRHYQRLARQDQASLYLEASNEHACGLYKKLGFVVVNKELIGTGKAAADGTALMGGSGLKLWDQSARNTALKEAYDYQLNLEAKYSQDSAYPTAFVMTANIEIDLSIDRLSLARSLARFQHAGYDLFSLSASYQQISPDFKTKMQSPVAGVTCDDSLLIYCRILAHKVSGISVQALHITTRLQTMISKLPRMQWLTSFIIVSNSSSSM